MEVFPVGGAVRDFLLAKSQGQFENLSSQEIYANFWQKTEKDWVVVGSTPEEMLALGYRQVGKSFPVFLHPKTKDEYALARTERKIAKGYTGFECYAAKDVTLEDDLKRRDLTINAIAMRVLDDDFSQYEIIDPYLGAQDLKQQLFRHISPAFAEDPVRILRVARLATRFPAFNVEVHTENLMKQMVMDGEVDALVAERVWQEWYRSLTGKAPWRFFDILQRCQAMPILFPQIEHLEFKTEILRSIPETAPEEIRLAIELYDLTNSQLNAIIKKYHIPNDYSGLALLVAGFNQPYAELNTRYNIVVSSNEDTLRYSYASEILKFLQVTDAFRRPNRFYQFITTCDYLGIDRKIAFKEIIDTLQKIDNTELVNQGYQGLDFSNQLQKIRLEKIQLLLR